MKKENLKNKLQILYLSHGGGPLPILGEKSHQAMIDFMKKLPSQLNQPDYIIVISAHWEEDKVAILGSKNPPVLYDYFGFPRKAYDIIYPAPGCPELANEILKLFNENNIPSKIDNERGFDHGLFIPLKLMYPEANIPSIQISLLNNLNPKDHISIGKILGKMKERNILIIGSGFSFHNLRAFNWEGNYEVDSENDLFQNWLIEVCTNLKKQDECEYNLINWEKAPSARYCHPREEHLLPLHVCVGIAEKTANLIFDDYILGKRSVAFLWK